VRRGAVAKITTDEVTIDEVTIDEASYTTLYDLPATERPCGFGRRIDDPELPGMAAGGTAVFGEAVAFVADALGVELNVSWKKGFMVLGMTAMPAVNAIPYVVAAPPGIVTYDHLPLVVPAGPAAR